MFDLAVERAGFIRTRIDVRTRKAFTAKDVKGAKEKQQYTSCQNIKHKSSKRFTLMLLSFASLASFAVQGAELRLK